MAGEDALFDRLERDARVEAAAVTSGAEQRVAEIQARAQAFAAQHRREARERWAAESRQAVSQGTAGAVRQGRKALLEARGQVVERVFAEAETQLRATGVERYRELLPVLVSETLRYLEDRAAVITCRPEVITEVRSLCEAHPDVEVRGEEGAVVGVLGGSADGIVLVDNTLPALLRVRRPELAIGIVDQLKVSP